MEFQGEDFGGVDGRAAAEGDQGVDCGVLGVEGEEGVEGSVDGVGGSVLGYGGDGCCVVGG